jgi:hypothetical protein
VGDANRAQNEAIAAMIAATEKALQLATTTVREGDLNDLE